MEGKLRILPAVLTALSLAACSTLSLPDTPEQSLLVLPSAVKAGDKDDVRISSVSLSLVRETDSRRFPFALSGSRSFSTLALDPGPYRFDSLQIARVRAATPQRPEQSWTDSIPLAPLRVYIEQTVVLLYDFRFVFEGAGAGQARFSFDPLSPTDGQSRAAILVELRKDAHWLGWDGYQLVNFAGQ